MTKSLEMLGKRHCLVVPVLALAALVAVTVVGAVETRAEHATTCGLVIHVQDPDLRARLVHFDRHQSAAARKVCASYRDRH